VLEEDLWTEVGASIAAATSRPFSLEAHTAVGGGCINDGHRICGSARCFFVKVNRAGQRAMFEAESEALRALAATATVRVPAPVCLGANGQHCWLVLEYLDLGHSTDASMTRLASNLAALHRSTADRFGWHRDNTIGSTPQHNDWSDAWVEFWRSHRLGFQLDLAARNGHHGRLQRQGKSLLDRLEALLDRHAPSPSLLHGDLWGGNAAATVNGEPVVFDPACYYGDREADLAMTELFGGFPTAFYAAYREAWPLDPGYAVRRKVYNLYHVLNHLNLFGGGYLGQAERLIQELLSEVR